MTELDDIDLQSPTFTECPYPQYATLRDEAPVWFDPGTQMYVVTRYDDVKAVLLDAKRFSNGKRGVVPRWPLMLEIYQRDGWVPGTSLGGLDNPEHRQLRTIFNHAFRPAQVDLLAPYMTDLANHLVDDFLPRGEIDFVAAFAVPFPLHVIGRQMGVDEKDLPDIKRWADAWIQRRGMMLSDDEVIRSTELEVQAQHYFQPIFERLRAQADETFLSDLVRTEVPGWGRTLTDNELHAEMMADMFVGGAESTTSAFSHGMQIVTEQPEIWRELRRDPSVNVPLFVEELLRLESPVQGMFRRATEDVELHGVTIPAGALVNVRFGAANRDERRFEDSTEFVLGRPGSGQHLAFGQGTHLCLGAPLARLELTIGFGVLVDRIDRTWFVPGANDFRHHPNMVVHELIALHLGVA